MKVHTTNYTDTFITVADDSVVTKAEIPPQKVDKKTAANIQFEMISKNPYRYTSDEVLFQVFATKNGLTDKEYEEARTLFFSKGQACFRASPLTKRYGWGVHHNKNGKMALFALESDDYEQYAKDCSLKVVKAMKSSR